MTDLGCTHFTHHMSIPFVTVTVCPYSLSDLEKFISVAEAGLSRQVEEGDYGGLVEVMGHLLAVKERQHTTDAMFEPLQQTIALLKVYEQELPDVVYKQLEVNNTKYTDVQSRQILSSLAFHWDIAITFSLCLPIAHLFSVLLLPAIHHLSLLPALFFSPSLHPPISIFNCLPICLSAGVAREVEQCAKAGCFSQTAGGAPAGHRGGQPAPEVRLVRCGAAHLQGAFSQQRALQVE